MSRDRTTSLYITELFCDKIIDEIKILEHVETRNFESQEFDTSRNYRIQNIVVIYSGLSNNLLIMGVTVVC
jgi:hypothetical protein